MCKASETEVCGATGDARPDTPPAACGNGASAPGEVCFDTPQVIDTNGAAFTITDARFAHADADEQLDLVWVDGAQFYFHLQVGGEISGASINGPSANVRKLAPVQVSSNRVGLIAAGSDIGAWVYDAPTGGWGTGGSLLQPTAFGPANSLALGRVSGPDAIDAVVRYAGQIVVASFNISATPQPRGQAVQIPMGESIAVGPVTSDDLDDIVYANAPGAMVIHGQVMSANGTFSMRTPTSIGAASAVALADMNGDGHLDLVYIDSAAGRLGVAIGASNGDFANPRTNEIIGIRPSTLEVADIDGDGRPDVLTTTNESTQLRIARNTGDGTLEVLAPIQIGVLGDIVRADSDYDGDGAKDVIVVSTSERKIAILTSNP